MKRFFAVCLLRFIQAVYFFFVPPPATRVFLREQSEDVWDAVCSGWFRYGPALIAALWIFSMMSLAVIFKFSVGLIIVWAFYAFAMAYRIYGFFRRKINRRKLRPYAH